MIKMHTKNSVLKFLRSNETMSLATSTLKGVPHVSIVFYAVDKDLNFYFFTLTKSKKSKQIKKNPNVSFTIGISPPLNIQASGKAKEIKGEAASKIVEDMLMAVVEKGHVWPPILHIKNDVDKYIIYKITTKSLRALDLKIGKIRMQENASPFTMIIGK